MVEYNVGEITGCDIFQHIQHLTLLFFTGKNIKGRYSVEESVRKEVERLGEESSMLHLSRKINFTLDLYFTKIKVDH